MITKKDYDFQNDIMFLHWGEEGTEVSEEITSHEGNEFVIDYDKKGRIVGIEIFNWSKGGHKTTKK